MKSKAGFVSWLRCRINILLPLFGSWIKKSVIQQWTSIKQKSFSWLWSLKLISQMCFDSFFVFLRWNMWRVSDIYKKLLGKSMSKRGEHAKSGVNFQASRSVKAACSTCFISLFSLVIWVSGVVWDSIRGTRKWQSLSFSGILGIQTTGPQTNKLTNSWERQESLFFLGCFQESYNTPLEHTPGNPPTQLWKDSLYNLLVKV